MIIPVGQNPNYEHFKQMAIEAITGLNQSYPWDVTFKRYRKPRSRPQECYHWGVIIKVMREETGNESDDLHEYLLGEHTGWVEYDVLGATKRRPAKRSKDMNVEEYENFNEYCRAFAASNLGLVIPLPGEGL